ncbi:MAG: hypothetical protein COB12_10410 [Flavobacterium sp.]|nr:MAG: hypothetical protein COB12_10410 [Flavobacterium sp.]
MLFWFAVVSAGGVIYWMRLQMENLGYNYSFLNSSFMMISDFYSRIGYDKKLKSKYYRTLIITLLLWLIISFMFWFISN